MPNIPKLSHSPERNVELIRRKNVEDNQIFLQNLLISNIRNDFVKSARSFFGRGRVKNKPGIQYQKVEHSTRYSLKVQSGEIDPYVPEWQRIAEQKKRDAEQKKLENERKKFEMAKKRFEWAKKREEKEKRRMLFREQRRLRRRSIWTIFNQNNANCNPYQRTFAQRHTQVDARIQHLLTNN